jgi:hypothetical protein
MTRFISPPHINAARESEKNGEARVVPAQDA